MTVIVLKTLGSFESNESIQFEYNAQIINKYLFVFIIIIIELYNLFLTF